MADFIHIRIFSTRLNKVFRSHHFGWIPGFLVIVLAMNICSLEARQSGQEARVDALFEPLDSETTPGCAVSVMQGGEILYKNGYGMANLEYGIEITPETIFHVASVSKQFTAMAVQLLVNNGEVSWDDDIRKYLPEVPDYGHTITLRQLAHHVSGVRDQWSLLMQAGWRWESDVVTQKDVLDITSRQKALNFEPGTRHLYSNTGYTLLGVVVERVSGQSLREFTTEHIFEPLGMENTHFQDDHRRIVQNRAWAYEPHREGEYGLRNSVPVFDVVGASSLFTTVEDIAAWDRNMYSGEVGGTDGIEQLHQPYEMNSGESTTYALGIIRGEHRGLETYGHGGADAGYRSQYLRIPDHEFGVSVFCNDPRVSPNALARRVADIYLGEHTEATRSRSSRNQGSDSDGRLSPDEMQNLEGIYVAQPGDRTMKVSFENNRLKLDVGPGVPLVPLGNDLYTVGRSDMQMEIKPGDKTGSGNAELRFTNRNDPDIYTRYDAWLPDEEDLKEFTGIYHSTELGTDYKFNIENGRLRFHHRKLESRTLTPVFPDAFHLQGRILTFTRDDRGNVDGFRVSDSRVWGVEFEKTE